MTPEQALAEIKADMTAACAEEIRRLTKDAAAKMALLNLDAGHRDADQDGLWAKQEQLSAQFAVRIASLMRSSGTRFRHVTLDTNLYLLLRETLSNRAGRFITTLIDRHTPQKQDATQDESFYADQFSQSEEESIRKGP